METSRIAIAGYRTYTGHILTQAEADILNKFEAEIERNPNNELLKDNKHKLFTMICMGYCDKK